MAQGGQCFMAQWLKKSSAIQHNGDMRINSISCTSALPLYIQSGCRLSDGLSAPIKNIG